MSVLWRYSVTPGYAAIPQVNWPANAPIQMGNGRATLVMFAHPNCPCSRASIGELAIIMARSQGALDAHVFFYIPDMEPSSWAKKDLWNNARRIPGVQVAEDRQGAYARLFGAFTSGQTFLYSSTGQLVFNGGITASRGHSGDNNGREAIVAYLHAGTVEQKVTSVFGCSLRGE